MRDAVAIGRRPARDEAAVAADRLELVVPLLRRLGPAAQYGGVGVPEKAAVSASFSDRNTLRHSRKCPNTHVVAIFESQICPASMLKLLYLLPSNLNSNCKRERSARPPLSRRGGPQLPPCSPRGAESPPRAGGWPPRTRPAGAPVGGRAALWSEACSRNPDAAEKK